MTTTLTQMARAHYEAMTRVPLHPLTPWAKWEELGPTTVAAKVSDMRAALEALREPSEGMVQAACDVWFGPIAMTPEEAADKGFTAMIDHALNEKGKEDG